MLVSVDVALDKGAVRVVPPDDELVEDEPVEVEVVLPGTAEVVGTAGAVTGSAVPVGSTELTVPVT